MRAQWTVAMATQSIAQNDVKSLSCAHNSCAELITSILVGPFFLAEGGARFARAGKRGPGDHNMGALKHAACVSTWLICEGPARIVTVGLQLVLPNVAWPAARSAALWVFYRRHNVALTLYAARTLLRF